MMMSNWTNNSPSCLPLQDHISMLRTPRGKSYNNILLPVTTTNAVIAVISAFLNSLIIWTISRTKSLQTPQNLLVLGLAIADFGASVISQPSFCVMKFAEYKRNEALFCSSGYAFTLSFWGFSTVSFATLSMITADRFLAVQLHLRYKEFVTNRRYGLTLIVIWIVCLTVGPLTRVFGQSQAALIACFTLLASILFINGYFLFKIFKTTHRHALQIRMQQNSVTITTPNNNQRKLKHSVYTVYFITGAFSLCYIPYCLSMVAFMFLKAYSSVALFFTISESLVMLNGLFNPILYFWRITNLRTEAIKVLKCGGGSS